MGKSRLVQEFCDRSHVPYVFYTATRGASATEAVGAFLAELRDSGLPRDRDLVPVDSAAGWPDAFRALASVLPDGPTIVVLDELPWIAEQDELFDGALQTAERIRKAVEAETMRSENGSFKCTLSLGIATFPQDANVKAKLAECADQALYQAKRSGRNRSIVFGSSPSKVTAST